MPPLPGSGPAVFVWIPSAEADGEEEKAYDHA